MRRSRLSYANITATLALFVALGGSATAAALIGGADVRNGSLTGLDVKNESLTGRDVENRSLHGWDLADGTVSSRALTPGVQKLLKRAAVPGPPGAQGAQGPAGLASTTTTAPDAPGYVSGADLVSVPVPAPGVYLARGALSLTNTGASAVNDLQCALLEGNQPVGGGDAGGAIAPGETNVAQVIGLGEVDSGGATLTFKCQYTGSLDASKIRLLLARLGS